MRSVLQPVEIEKTTRDLERFVAEFGDVVVPDRIPRWLWGGHRGTTVPGIRIAKAVAAVSAKAPSSSSAGAAEVAEPRPLSSLFEPLLEVDAQETDDALGPASQTAEGDSAGVNGSNGGAAGSDLGDSNIHEGSINGDGNGSSNGDGSGKNGTSDDGVGDGDGGMSGNGDSRPPHPSSSSLVAPLASAPAASSSSSSFAPSSSSSASADVPESDRMLGLGPGALKALQLLRSHSRTPVLRYEFIPDSNQRYTGSALSASRMGCTVGDHPLLRELVPVAPATVFLLAHHAPTHSLVILLPPPFFPRSGSPRVAPVARHGRALSQRSGGTVVPPLITGPIQRSRRAAAGRPRRWEWRR
jgi:hypothetical protein